MMWYSCAISVTASLIFHVQFLPCLRLDDLNVVGPTADHLVRNGDPPKLANLHQFCWNKLALWLCQPQLGAVFTCLLQITRVTLACASYKSCFS